MNWQFTSTTDNVQLISYKRNLHRHFARPFIFEVISHVVNILQKSGMSKYLLVRLLSFKIQLKMVAEKTRGRPTRKKLVLIECIISTSLESAVFVNIINRQV